MPKRVKHRKQFRGSMAGKATRGNKITNGEYGIACAAALAAAVAGALAWLWRTALRTRSGIGRLCAVGKNP